MFNIGDVAKHKTLGEVLILRKGDKEVGDYDYQVRLKDGRQIWVLNIELQFNDMEIFA